MFSADERALMERYATAVRATDIPKGGRMPDGGRAAGLAAHVLNVLAGVVGLKLGGPVGATAAYGMRLGQRALTGGLDARRAARSFEGGAPATPQLAPAYAAALGLRTGQGLGRLAPGVVPADVR